MCRSLSVSQRAPRLAWARPLGFQRPCRPGIMVRIAIPPGPMPHVFTIPAGAPFLQCFVAALLEGRIDAGFSRALGPLELADATIYVPTRRAARALIDEFARALGRPATLLPRILPLGALDATETSLAFEEPGLEAPLSDTLPLAARDIWRRMHCARLSLAWAHALHHAIISVDRSGGPSFDVSETLLVGTSSLDAWHLAGELVDLIDELIIEDVAWERLDPLVLPDFDKYWRITLDFLNIAMEQWPRILADYGLVDAATRRMRLIEEQMQAIQAGRLAGPVIAIGSTGSNRATARLLAAIARAPRGAVVLPGLDQTLDDRTWQRIALHHDGTQDPAFGHPQAAFNRLLPMLGIGREDVVEIGSVAPPLAARARLLSEALRPAETTELWRDYRAATPAEEIELALADVTFVEAADDREEALALAVALRQVVETPEATAALVTPDRNLARRVAAELTRWGIEIDDSAGEPLSASPYGVLAMLVAAAGRERAAPDIVALIGHPMARLGQSRKEIERLAPLFEIGVLRCGFDLRDFNSASAVIAAAEAAVDQFPHPAKRRIGPDDWRALEDLVGRLFDALAPFGALRGANDLHQWIAAHRAALELITRGDRSMIAGDDYEAFVALFDELEGSALPELTFDADAYALFIARLAGETVLHRARRTHPRLKIFGLLEARLMPADVVLLGGLDETIWPPLARSDAFLNRPMRAALGLTPPERRIGQTAHDFVAAMGHRKAILSRALKRAGVPTVASRFVQRLAAVAGARFERARERGRTLVEFAQALDRPAAVSPPAQRPMPRPDVGLRPRRLSVTRIEMLRRDPYAVYGASILRLAALSPLGRQTGVQLVGSAIHAVLEHFVLRFPAGPLPKDARGILDSILRDRLATELADPDFAAFHWPAIARAVDFYLAFEAERRDSIERISVEVPGEIEIPLADGTSFTLSAKADRLEHRKDGAVALVDYKTGVPPGVNEVHVGFAPQLTLETAMAARGAFGLKPGTRVDEALYLKLGGRDGGAEKALIFKKQKEDLATVAERHFAFLAALLDQFRRPETAYPPRPFPKFAARYNDYDHLARVKEWSTGFEEGDGD
jgi:ATP-dependent helicase/nuclease subunit B